MVITIAGWVFDLALERAQRGLAWLKEFGPRYGWDYKRINPDTLYVGDPHRCPLAQVTFHGNYSVAVNGLMASRSDGMPVSINDWITDYGFDVSPWDPRDMYDRLSEAWVQVLRQDQLEREEAAA